METLTLGIAASAIGSLAFYIVAQFKFRFILKQKNIEITTAIERSKILQEQIGSLKETLVSLETRHSVVIEANEKLTGDFQRRNREVEAKLLLLLQEKEAVTKELITLREQEPIRIEEHRKNIEMINHYYLNLEKEKLKEMEKKAEFDLQRAKFLKETWVRHEASVEEKMRLICQKLSIDYITKEMFPFPGKPDNIIKICGEYIVFDSKSPQGEDLTNFRSYIRVQSETVKKYLKHDEVKRDVFFVVPAETLSVLDETFINLASYRVHLIAIDSLEVVLRQLQKVEEYEYAESLSPEEREKIFSVLGKMMHGMKRRVQIDNFMANEFISILNDAENMPDDILQGAQKVEYASKLNPPTQKRAKRIELNVLSQERLHLIGKLESLGIHTGTDLSKIDEVPLDRSIHKKVAD